MTELSEHLESNARAAAPGGTEVAADQRAAVRGASDGAQDCGPLVRSYPAAPHPVKRPRLVDLSAAEATGAFAELGWPRYRAEQVLRWVHARGVTDPDRMTDLSKRDRAALAEHFDTRSPEITADQRSSDGTRKLLLTWPDGSVAETVMIPDGDRRTACVSSQVGCPVGCRFCASGLAGVKGNLTAGQIVEQIDWLNRGFRDPAERVTNVVFMGMGEPLANYANVIAAVRRMNDPAGLNLGARRLTISTVGVPARIRQLAAEEIPVNLAFSLHAPNEPLRRELIPWAEHFSLPDILDALRFYFDRTGREITLEYILLKNVNDRPHHARELAGLCRTLRANVNLLRYNPVAGLPFDRPQAGDVVAFQEILRRAGVNAHVRKSRGRDIDAACGQLRRERESLVQVGGGKMQPRRHEANEGGHEGPSDAASRTAHPTTS